MKRYLALKASAGSGKTFALTIRYISLLLKGACAKEILTLTFTNKSANEMNDRIYHTLLSLGDDKAYLEEIIKQSNLSLDEIVSKKQILIEDFTNSHLSIFTIDKFINKILREFSGYLGISDDFEITEDDIQSLSMKFLSSLDKDNFNKLIMYSHFEKKKFASLFTLFQILLEKNETITVVNIDLSLIGLQKEQVLKSAYKIKDFVLNFTSASASAKKAVSFDNFDDLIKNTWLVKQTLSEYSYFKKISNELLELNFISLKKELNIYYKLQSSYNLSKLYELYILFKNYKIKYNKIENVLTFSDVSNLVLELLSNSINKDFLYFRLDAQYSHILIDEFQDTSMLQYKILEPIINEILSGQVQDNKSFFYVGDTKQSIYRFRGGRRELFDYVYKTNPMIHCEILNTNYRSCKNIISYVNSLFIKLNNYEYFEQKSIYENGYVNVIEDSSFEDEDKFKTLAKEISILLKNGVNFNDIAILTYTNSDVLNIYSYLKDKFPSLKISTEMTSKLINQANIKVIINAVKYLYFKEDLYKENINALINKKPLSTLILDLNIKKISIKNLIFEIAKILNIMDDNVIKLIEISSCFKNVLDFIYEVDKLTETMVNNVQQGLQILTIFKSKGLEFHTVIYIDRIKKKNSNKDLILFEYDNLKLKNTYYKIPQMQYHNEHYEKAIQKEKNLELEDELNILYVAMTRAKKNMIILKKQKNSVFDLLDMKNIEIGNIIKSTSANIINEKIEKIQYKAINLGIQEKPISIEEDIKEYSLHAKYFGLALHYFLEMLSEFTKQNVENNIHLLKNRYSSYLDDVDFLDIQNRSMNLINNSIFQNLLQGANVTCEQSLLYDNKIKIIDLLLYKDLTYYIFDYKTTKDELAEHIIQVQEYKKAIGKIFNTNKVIAYIIYLNKNDVKLKKV